MEILLITKHCPALPAIANFFCIAPAQSKVYLQPSFPSPISSQIYAANKNNFRF